MALKYAAVALYLTRLDEQTLHLERKAKREKCLLKFIENKTFQKSLPY